MQKFVIITIYILLAHHVFCQPVPSITSWLQNNTIKGKHYVKGNATPFQDNVLANVQKVQYSDNWVYIFTRGIPAFITGPFQDGNPSLASDQNAIFRLPLKPVKNEGTLSATTLGNIGNFVNGVAMFDYRDGVSWSSASNSLKGGPLGGMGDNVWNRDAVVAERVGFDCAKAHPAMGNYHHHQNPSAFRLDKAVISDVCDLFPSDGLYVIDSLTHSPLIGFAYDGFPVYGPYAFKNTDGTGGITRMKSAFTLRNISSRNTLYTGQAVKSGPDVSNTYPLGYFKEDYQYVEHSISDYLDEHNGRFCITPDYPEGIYCYFATVDENWNSAYPYLVGPTFYGIKTAGKVNTITESVSTYTTTGIEDEIMEYKISILPNPASDFTAIQIGDLVKNDVNLTLSDIHGKVIYTLTLGQGSTMGVFDLSKLYDDTYLITVKIKDVQITKKLLVLHE